MHLLGYDDSIQTRQSEEVLMEKIIALLTLLGLTVIIGPLAYRHKERIAYVIGKVVFSSIIGGLAAFGVVNVLLAVYACLMILFMGVTFSELYLQYTTFLNNIF